MRPYKPRKRWTRVQELAVLYLKIRYRDQITAHHNLDVVCALAEAMDRSIDSVFMRKANFDALDPAVSRMGLGQVSRLTESVWQEYQDDPDAIVLEAIRAYYEITGVAP